MINDNSAQRVVDLSESYGFSLEETGGGCTALQKLFDDDSYILITRLGDTSVPTDADQAVTVGWYTSAGFPTRKPMSFADLATALDAIAHS